MYINHRVRPSPPCRLQPGEMELGLGIHGEPGYQKAGWLPAQQLVPQMLQRVLDYGGGALGVHGSDARLDFGR